MASTKNEQKSPEEQLFVENSPLYKRMSIICHVVIYLYATAFWIQVGVFPFLSKKLNVDTVVFGYLQTVFAVAMLMGGPIFGRMGDIFGVKIVFLISFGGSFLFYFFVAIADGVFYLFISRSMAFTMNAMQCAQMVITDVTGTRDRATSMGHLTVAYGLGMITGPTVGGWIAKFSNEQNAAAVSAILMILAFLIILFTVPNHTKDPRKLAESKKTDSPKEVEDNKRIFDISAILKLLSIPEVFYLISIRTIIGIPAGVFHSMFSVVNIERFSLTPEINGYLLTYIGLLTAVMQGVGIKFFTSRFSDLVLIRVSLVAMAFSYLLLVGVSSLWILALILIPMAMSGNLMNTVASSALTKSVPDQDTGTIIGLNMATNSLIRTISPTVGSYLYMWFDYYSFGMLGFILNGAVATLVCLRTPPGTQIRTDLS